MLLRCKDMLSCEHSVRPLQHSGSQLPLAPSPAGQTFPAPLPPMQRFPQFPSDSASSCPLHSLIPTQYSSVRSGLDHSSSSPHDLFLLDHTPHTPSSQSHPNLITLTPTHLVQTSSQPTCGLLRPNTGSLHLLFFHLLLSSPSADLPR